MDISLSQNLQSAENDRVRRATTPEVNRKIDMQLEHQLRFYACQDKETISDRIQQLEQEWDIEQVLQANAASLSLFGVTMAIVSGRKWLILPLVVGGFLLQHATKGWCPPLPLFRKYGIRTRSEIEQERYALKMLRGDFDNLEREQNGSFKHDINRLLRDIRGNGNS